VIVVPPTAEELYEKFKTLLEECTTLEELKTCYLEVVANKSTLGESYYKSLANLKDHMKSEIEGEEEPIECINGATNFEESVEYEKS
jgi:hypothetical protein